MGTKADDADEPVPSTSKTAEPLTLDAAPFEALIGADAVELVFSRAPTKVRSRIASALHHFARAQKLIGVDEEMGAIRCIAAEEELVVAIFEWLKLNAKIAPDHRDFIGMHKNHLVKLAFYPVLSQFRFVIQDAFTDGITVPGREDAIHWILRPACINGEMRLEILKAGGEKVTDIDPMSSFITNGDRSDEEVVDLMYKELCSIVEDQQGLTVKQFITRRADYRNKLLYAGDGGSFAMNEPLAEMISTMFSQSLKDLLWCLAVLLSERPNDRPWFLAAQFVALYRRVLMEAKLIKTATT